MKKLGLVVALSTALLQADTFTGAKIVSSDPTGACSDATTLYVSTASGKIFLCSQGQYAAPNPTLATSPTTVLTLTTNPLPAAKDTVILNVSEDAYQGDALFSASIDGQQLSASTKVTSIRRNGQTQNIAFTGNWGAGPHTVKVTFLNDAWDGNTAPNDINDRNLYVNSVSYNSVSSSVDRTNLMSANDTATAVVGGAVPPIVPNPTPVAGSSNNGVPTVTVPAVPAGARDLKVDFHAAGNGTTDDTAALRNALNSGAPAIVIPAGTYKLTDSVSAQPGTRIFGQGNPVLNQTNSGKFSAINFGGTGFEVYNVTFQGAGIELNGNNNDDEKIVIARNTFQHITNGGDGIHEYAALGHSTIDSNKFYDIGKGGMAAYANTPVPWDTDGSGFFSNGFFDSVHLTNNVIDYMTFDGLKGFFNQLPHANDFLLAGNKATHVHRIAFEFQDCYADVNGCFSGKGGSHIKGVFKDNFYSDPWYGDQGSFAFSFPVDNSDHQQVINNTAVNNYACCYGSGQWEGYGIETSGNYDLVQGNVIVSTMQTAGVNNWPGFGNPIGFDNSNLGIAQNNLLCGADSKITQGGLQGNGVVFPTNQNIQFNIVNQNACPIPDSELTKSHLQMGISGQNAWVTNNLSINKVDFYLDSATTPFNTQELGDLNSNFANDGKWLYHAGLDSSKVANGQHTIKAVATDVIGTTQSATASITVAH